VSFNLFLDVDDCVATRASRVRSRDSRFFNTTRIHRPTGAVEVEVHERAGVMTAANSPGPISCALCSPHFHANISRRIFMPIVHANCS